MSEFISELKAAWVGNRRRKFYQSTRGIMTPEERQALEEEFERKLAEHDRQVAERAWDEGLDAQKDYAWRCEDADAAGQGVWVRPPENPYRGTS